MNLTPTQRRALESLGRHAYQMHQNDSEVKIGRFGVVPWRLDGSYYTWKKLQEMGLVTYHPGRGGRGRPHLSRVSLTDLGAQVLGITEPPMHVWIARDEVPSEFWSKTGQEG